jgi:hypothetical protein
MTERDLTEREGSSRWVLCGSFGDPCGFTRHRAAGNRRSRRPVYASLAMSANSEWLGKRRIGTAIFQQQELSRLPITRGGAGSRLNAQAASLHKGSCNNRPE